MSGSLPAGFQLVDQGDAAPSDTGGPPAGFKMVPEAPHQLYRAYNPAAPSGFALTEKEYARPGEILIAEPPPEIAPLVKERADKYGVPLSVAHFVGGRESSWNPEAVGPETKHGRAQGMWQFMPGTAQQFGINPKDVPASTDAAMRYLRQLADANGGDWEKAVEQYGTFSTGKGPEADAKVRQAFRDYVGKNEPTAQDVAQGTGRGLITGAGTVLGLPSDIWQMLDKGYQYALTEGAAKLGLLSEEDAARLRQPIEGEQYQTGSEAVNRHLLGLAKRAGANTDRPLTVPGQYAETMASFAPAAGTFGAGSARELPGAIAKWGLLPGAASEVLGQATKDTELEPYARVAGAMAPAVPLAGIAALRSLANPLGSAVATAQPTEMVAAQRLLDLSRAEGAPLTVPEAVQQATGSATRLGDIQRVVEQSPEGAAIMRPFYAQRPGQTQQLGQSALSQVAPPIAEPYEVPPQVQQAAASTVRGADQARAAATTPYYKAATADRVPAQEMEVFLRKLDKMIAADKTGVVSQELGKIRNALTETQAQAAIAAQRVPIQTPTGQTIYRHAPGQPSQPRVPVTDIENLDNARKFFRDLIAQPPWAQNAVPKFTGTRIQGLLNELSGMMERSSPNFAAGKALHQQITERQFNPLLRSPTGQLAEAESFGKQAGILFHPNPPPGSERAVAKAIRDVVKANPDAARALVRMHLERVFNEATQANLPGPNQFGGPKFVAVVAGNSQQAKNLEAAVKALPNGSVRWNALRKAMDIMQAMGTRQPVGSQTEFNRMINEYLKDGKPIGEAIATAGSPARWTRVVSDLYQRFAYRQNTKELARVFTEGNVADLQRIAQSGAQTLRGQAALVVALGHEGAVASPEGTSAPP